ncbi:MAG: PQQ-dependent sugar dehydrogenase [Armatimonadetes bacterium]|nr:PQQ-dependent sugar dehydrogenase [Armatimonadota bacterium]
MLRPIGVAAAFFALSCGDPSVAPRAAGVGVQTSGSVRFRVETVAEGLRVPWEIAFAPDGRIFVTERQGRIRVIENGKLRPEPLAVIKEAVHRGEGGLMGLALHPKFSENGWIYVSYLYQDGGLTVRVERYTLRDDALQEPKVILDGIEGGGIHNGCRIAFGPDGKLYVTTGEVGRGDLAQQLNTQNGKTLRINDDGSVPRDNPFVGRAGARPEIWSYGHRNAQGIAWQPGTRLMFQTEHGPSGFDAPGGGDEVNIVESGKNYGWPAIHHRETREGMVSPLLEYTPAVAPGGCTFYSGAKIPEWKGNFFFACLRGRRIIRVELDGRRVVSQENLLQDKFGRIRQVVEGPDGYLYFCTSNQDGRGRPAGNDDRVLRIVPAE